MIFTETPLKGSYIIEPKILSDNRGWFSRIFDKELLDKITGTREWVQGNHSFTAAIGSVRGLHFQRAPNAEAKIVRCIAGAIFDVIVDIRQGSPTMLNWFGVELSAANRKMIFIPEGFAHGFQTLSKDTELIYSHSAPYTPASEAALKFDDPVLNIQWPLTIADISARDQQHPYIDSFFTGEKTDIL